MRIITTILAIAFLAACASAKSAGAGGKVLHDDEQVEIDHLKLAATMIRNGEYDHAEKELLQVNQDAERFDRARFFTLRGVVGLHRQAYLAAKEDFTAAITNGQREPVVQVYLAQAHYSLGEWLEALEALRRAGESQASFSSLHAMRIQCCWKLKDVAGAFGAITEAERRFPDQPEFTRQKLYYLLELSLFKDAEEVGNEYLSRSGRSMAAFLALGEAFRRHRQLERALRVLEEGRLRYPAEEHLLVTLARTYLDKGLPRSAAQILEEASILHPKYAPEAAELYRRSGDLYRALYLNTGLSDQKVKARQRLGLLLEAQRFEEAVSLEPRLERMGLLDDEDVRYALAFTHFRTGEFARSEEHLKTLTRPELFKASAELRKAIEAARGEGTGR